MTTITREQFLAIAGCESSSELARKLEQIGITIADPDPPEEMVKLARTIARVAGCAIQTPATSLPPSLPCRLEATHD